MPIKNKHKRVTPGPGPHTGAGQRISAEGGFQTPAYAGTSLAFTGITFPSKPAVDVDAFLDGNTDFPFHSSAEIATSLLQCYTHYCKLANAKPVSLTATTPGLQCYKIYNALKDLLNKQHTGPGKVQLNVEQTDTGEFYFVAYKHYLFHHEVAIFPLKMLYILQQAGSAMLKPFTEFMRFALHHTGFSSYQRIDRFAWCIEMVSSYADEIAYEEPARTLELASDMETYVHGLADQYVNSLLKTNCKSIAAIERRAKTVVPHTTIDMELYSLMLEGIELFKQPGVCDMRSLDYIDFTTVEEGDVIQLEDLFVIAWDVDDNVVEEYFNALNQDSGEVGVIEPNQWHVINKNTSKPFTYNPWPANFLEWFYRLIQFYNELPHRAN